MFEFSLRLTEVQRYYNSSNAFRVVRWFLEVQKKNLEAIHFIAIPTIKYYRT